MVVGFSSFSFTLHLIEKKMFYISLDFGFVSTENEESYFLLDANNFSVAWIHYSHIKVVVLNDFLINLKIFRLYSKRKQRKYARFISIVGNGPF
jgi:hypothetical protein